MNVIKIYLFAFAVLLSSLVYPLFYGVSFASAATYDIQTVNTLKIGGSGSGSILPTPCAVTDMTVDWAQFPQPYNSGAAPWSYQKTWNYESNYDNAQSSLNTWVGRFNTQLSAGVGWAVTEAAYGNYISQSSPDYDTFHKRIYIYTFPSDTTFTFNQSNQLVSSKPMRVTIFSKNPNASCRYQVADIDSQTSYITPTQQKIFLINSAGITYPPDYTGTLIPQAYNPKSKHYPNVQYDVSGLEIAARHKAQLPGVLKIDWKLYEADDNYNAVGPPIRQQLNMMSSASGTSFYYEVPAQGRYLLDVYEYAPPGSPLLDDYEFKPLFIHLNVDGSTYSSTSKECINGVCDAPTPYQDCTSFGADLIGGIGCYIDNFKTWLVITVRMLFIPPMYQLRDLFTDFSDFLGDKLGFLWYPFDFFIDLFTALPSVADSCSFSTVGVPGVTTGTFFGSNFNLNVCSAEQNFPQIYNISVFFIRLVTVFGLIYALYRRFFEFIEHRDSRKDYQL